jgi:YD repeat-containing protein
VSFLAGPVFAGEATPLKRDPEAAKKLLDLPEASEAEYAQVEGTWELAQDTNQANRWRRVKSHQAGKTTVTAYDAEGKIVGQHNSEYKLKKSGLARIFVYFNVVPATGPSKGHELPGPFYYAYNVQDNTFVEAYGLLVGDDRSPRVLLWNRVKE